MLDWLAEQPEVTSRVHGQEAVVRSSKHEHESGREQATHRSALSWWWRKNVDRGPAGVGSRLQMVNTKTLLTRNLFQRAATPLYPTLLDAAQRLSERDARRREPEEVIVGPSAESVLRLLCNGASSPSRATCFLALERRCTDKRTSTRAVVGSQSPCRSQPGARPCRGSPARGGPSPRRRATGAAARCLASCEWVGVFESARSAVIQTAQ